MAINETEKIIKEVGAAYKKHRKRLIRFFMDEGFTKPESDNLAHCIRNAVYFLGTHEWERIDVEVELRASIKKKLKQEKEEIAKLVGSKNALKGILPQLDWDGILEHRIRIIDEHPFTKTRAGKNKSLALALEPLFWKLKRMGYGQSQQVNIVHNLFIEFQLDDYAREPYHTKKQLIGPREKNERIRKQFQQPAMKSREEYARLFGWTD